MENMFKEIFEYFVNENTRIGNKVCILRKYESLPEKNLGHDVDIMVERRFKRKVKLILKNMEKRFGLERVQFDEKTGIRIFWKSYVNFDKEITKGKNNILSFDIQFDILFYGVPYWRGEYILNEAENYKNFFIPKKVDEKLIKLLPILLYTKQLNEKEKLIIRKLVKKNNKEFKKRLCEIFGKRYGQKVYTYLLKGNIDDIANVIRRVSIILWTKSFLRNPLRGIKGLFLLFIYKIKEI